MRICIKSLCCFGIMLSVFFVCDANAATKKCPAGFFCTSGGSYEPYQGGIQAYQMGPAELATIEWGEWSNEGLCSKRSGTGHDTICSYFIEDYDEVWVSTWFGFYLVKNGNVTYHAGGTTPASGAFPCPGTYPSSAEGANSVFECYRVISNGQKQYYKNNKSVSYSGANNPQTTGYKKCPAGFFCTSGGFYMPYQGGIQAYQMGPAELATSSWGDWSEEGFCSSCKNSRSGCAYCGDDYDEAWVSVWFGFYLIKNGEVMYNAGGTTPAQGAFPCPGTYPSSAEGASSVFECYKVVANGQKEYYKAPQSTKNTFVGAGATKITNKYSKQNAAKSVDVNVAKNTNVQANKMRLSTTKALIDAGITTGINSQNDTTTTTDNKSGQIEIETAKALINAGITTGINSQNDTTETTTDNSVDPEIEKAKALIKAGI